MPLDPSIILGVKPMQVQSPQELYAQKAQFDQNQLAQRLGQMKVQEFEQGQRDQNQLRSVYSQFGNDTAANVNSLYKAGYGGEAQKYSKGQTEQQEARAKASTAETKLFRDNLSLIAANPTPETMNTVFADLERQTGRPAGTAKQLFAGAQTPEQIRQIAMKIGIELEKQLPTYQTRNTGGTTDTLSIDPITGKVAVANSVRNTQSPDSIASQATAMRGQNMTDARAKEANGKGQYDAERGLLIDPRTGQARQVVGADGQPIAPKGGAGKMTEDQGKATGWLIQAENAFKNMKAAGFDAKGNPKSAAYPGPNDAIAAIPGGAPVANWMRSPDRQKFIQGASSLSEALLRAATGAGVNESEAKQKIAELTPLFGEDEATTKQKMAAIPLYIEALKVRAGPGATKAQQVGGGATGGWDGGNDPLGLRK